MKEFFSVQEVAKLLDLSHSGVLYHIKSKKLKSTQVGKIYIIKREDFADFLKDQKKEKKSKKKPEEPQLF
ncbi:MAG: helix-turn-helix domain-containing protein [Ignavibacteriota bacterium]|jgi:excisionase family DNA binding protein|nr:DNA-binding protein [Ignavibacteriota bacterium]MBW7843624.1 helix-turn-helix domain-containing protein [Ignavibacterium sp.]MCO6447560.1 helix-turn-helix domain-containing protein [Ignavibacterium album]MCZ2270004.1 helix-turn-helix domain-containing protein [Ignavibacteriales bacterium]MDX9713518.1 helix-turn-helix domain-containing protein [Ignavibacteriaceae bacterium]